MIKEIYRLEGLECANCAAKMEKAISKLDGVQEISINFMTTKMTLCAEDDKMPEILESARKIIKKTESHVIMKKG